MAQIGGPLIAVWATVFLALLALRDPAVPRAAMGPPGTAALRASLAWLGFAIMTPVGCSA